MESCTLYIDGAGTHDLSSKDVYYTLAGIVLTPKQYSTAYKKSQSILQKYITKRSSQKSKHYELHYTDIFFRKNIFQALDKDRNLDMINDVYSLITKMNLQIMATSVNQDQLSKLYTSPKPSWTLAFKSILNKFRIYCNNMNKVGSVISDIEPNIDRIKIERMLAHALPSAHTFDNDPHASSSYHSQLSFRPSYKYVGIQLADFIAGAVWQYRERHNSRDYKRIESLWGDYPDNIIST